MYLLISDKNALSSERTYYSVSGDWFAEVAKCFPDYSTVNSDDIEEILIYSSQASDSGESFLRVDYDNPQEIELTSGDVRKRRYGYCKRNDLLSEKGFPPSVIFVDDIREFKRIKSGKTQFVINENLLSRLADMVTKNDWIGIVKCFPNKGPIHVGCSNIEVTETIIQCKFLFVEPNIIFLELLKSFCFHEFFCHNQYNLITHAFFLFCCE